MVRRFHRSIYDELDELRASMDYLYQLALEPADDPLLPEGDAPGIVCQAVHSLEAEVVVHGDDVTVTLDTVLGTGNKSVSVELVNEYILRITCDQEGRTGDTTGESPREWQSFSLHHIIPLPHRVMKRGARLSIRHGVLDICLKKARSQ